MRKSNPAIHSLLLFLSITVFIQTASGQSVLYTSYPNGATFLTHQGVAIYGSNASYFPAVPYEAEARKFSPLISGYLGDIQIPIIGPPNGKSNTFNLEICLDNSGLPGQAIEILPMTAGSQTSGQVQDIFSLLHPYLSASSTYWLALLPDDSHSYCSWCEFSPPTLISGVSVNDNGTGWQVRGIYPVNPFIVIGTVPEPHSEALLIFALASAFVFPKQYFFYSRLARLLGWKKCKNAYMPNQAPEPTAVGAVSCSVAVYAARRRRLSLFVGRQRTPVFTPSTK